MVRTISKPFKRIQYNPKTFKPNANQTNTNPTNSKVRGNPRKFYRICNGEVMTGSQASG